MTDTIVQKAAKAIYSEALPWSAEAGSVALQNKSPIVVQKAFNRSERIKTLLEQVGINKKQATTVVDSLKDIILVHLLPEGPQNFK